MEEYYIYRQHGFRRQEKHSPALQGCVAAQRKEKEGNRREDWDEKIFIV
jgi:hypothetical protein